MTTLAGVAGAFGAADGIGSAARFHSPIDITSEGSDMLYVADQNNSTIRSIRISTGAVATLAGTAAMYGSTDGTGAAARFNTPNGIIGDGQGHLYVIDYFNTEVRAINIATKTVTTLAGQPRVIGSTDGVGTSALFNYPKQSTLDGGGNLLITDTSNGTVRKLALSNNAVSTFAGVAGASAILPGPLPARLNTPDGIVMTTANDVLVVDAAENCVLIFRLP